MGAHLDRARLLYQQGRYRLAEQELQQELTTEPENPAAYALLSLCLDQQKQHEQALRTVQRAIGLAPERPYSHYVLAFVLCNQRRLAEAEEAVAEALRLAPENVDYRALRSRICIRGHRYQAAVDAADQGLSLDPQHLDCLNWRAMALLLLDRVPEAALTLETALATDPEDAFSFALQGWVLLESRNPAAALQRFREALRLAPDLKLARLLIVDALKARHWLYRLLRGRWAWLGALAASLSFGLIGSLLLGSARLFPWATLTLLLLYCLLRFYLCDVLCLLALRFDRFGHLALSPEQLRASNWLAGCLLVILVSLGGWLGFAHSAALFALMVAGFLLLMLPATLPDLLPRRTRLMGSVQPAARQSPWAGGLRQGLWSHRNGWLALVTFTCDRQRSRFELSEAGWLPSQQGLPLYALRGAKLSSSYATGSLHHRVLLLTDLGEVPLRDSEQPDNRAYAAQKQLEFWVNHFVSHPELTYLRAQSDPRWPLLLLALLLGTGMFWMASLELLPVYLAAALGLGGCGWFRRRIYLRHNPDRGCFELVQASVWTAVVSRIPVELLQGAELETRTSWVPDSPATHRIILLTPSGGIPLSWDYSPNQPAQQAAVDRINAFVQRPTSTPVRIWPDRAWLSVLTGGFAALSGVLLLVGLVRILAL